MEVFQIICLSFNFQLLKTDVFYVTEGLNVSTHDKGKSKDHSLFLMKARKTKLPWHTSIDLHVLRYYSLYLKQAFVSQFISLSIEAKHEQIKYNLNVSPISLLTAWIKETNLL